MKFEYPPKDLPVVPPGCPAATWGINSLPPPTFPVDLTGELASKASDPAVFSLPTFEVDDSGTVEVIGSFDAGEYFAMVPTEENPDIQEPTLGTVYVTTGSLMLAEGSDLAEAAQSIDDDPWALRIVRDQLYEEVKHCPGLTPEGTCGALNAERFEAILRQVAVDYNYLLPE